MNPKHSYQLKKPQGLYGHYIAHFLKKRNESVYSELEPYLDITGDIRLLEIGYGPGLNIRNLMHKYNNIHLTGIDFSELMYKKAGWKNRKYLKKGDVNLICDDFNTYDFNDSAFDRIYFTNVIYFWDDYESSLNKIFSLLDYNGCLVFHMADKVALENNEVTNTPVFNKYQVEDVIDTMGRIGFKNIKHYSATCKDNHYFIKGIK